MKKQRKMLKKQVKATKARAHEWINAAVKQSV